MQIANRLFCDTFHAKNIDIVGGIQLRYFHSQVSDLFFVGQNNTCSPMVMCHQKLANHWYLPENVTKPLSLEQENHPTMQ